MRWSTPDEGRLTYHAAVYKVVAIGEISAWLRDCALTLGHHYDPPPLPFASPHSPILRLHLWEALYLGGHRSDRVPRPVRALLALALLAPGLAVAGDSTMGNLSSIFTTAVIPHCVIVLPRRMVPGDEKTTASIIWEDDMGRALPWLRSGASACDIREPSP